MEIRKCRTPTSELTLNSSEGDNITDDATNFKHTAAGTTSYTLNLC